MAAVAQLVCSRPGLHSDVSAPNGMPSPFNRSIIGQEDDQDVDENICHKSPLILSNAYRQSKTLTMRLYKKHLTAFSGQVREPFLISNLITSLSKYIILLLLVSVLDLGNRVFADLGLKKFPYSIFSFIGDRANVY